VGMIVLAITTWLLPVLRADAPARTTSAPSMGMPA
jgi:hypothetical protein